MKKHFTKWKDDSLKGLVIKKTIIVRISVSREKDNKNKSFSEKKIIKDNHITNNENKNKIDLSKFIKVYPNSEKDKHIKKSEFKPYKNNSKINKEQKEPSSYNNLAWKNHIIISSSKDNKTNKTNKTKKNNIYNNYININRNNNKRENRYRLLNESGNEKPKALIKKRDDNKKLQKSKSTFSKPVYEVKIQTTNLTNQNKDNNNYKIVQPNASKNVYIYKSNNGKLFDRKYDIKNRKEIKNDIKNNTLNNFYKKSNQYLINNRNATPNKSLGTIKTGLSKRKQQISNTIKKQTYNVKKNFPLTDKKINPNKSYINNTFRNKKYNEKTYLIGNRDGSFIRKLICHNCMDKKKNKSFIKDSNLIDKETLKKGITRVIQYYSGIKEVFVNYDFETYKSQGKIKTKNIV